MRPLFETGAWDNQETGTKYLFKSFSVKDLSYVCGRSFWSRVRSKWFKHLFTEFSHGKGKKSLGGMGRGCIFAVRFSEKQLFFKGLSAKVLVKEKGMLKPLRL